MAVVRLPTSPATSGLTDLVCTFFDSNTNTVVDVQPCVEMDICKGVYEARTAVVAADLWSHVTSAANPGINAVNRVLPNLSTIGSGVGISGSTNVDSALETAYELSILDVVRKNNTSTQALHTKADAIQAGVDSVQASSAQSSSETVAVLSSLSDIKRDTSFIRNIEGGRWQIDDVFMVFYAEDNVQEIARFQMLDSNGNPTANPTKAYQRVRV